MPLINFSITLGRTQRFSDVPIHDKFVCIADLERNRTPLLRKLATDADNYNAEYVHRPGNFCTIRPDDDVVIID